MFLQVILDKKKVIYYFKEDFVNHILLSKLQTGLTHSVDCVFFNSLVMEMLLMSEKSKNKKMKKKVSENGSESLPDTEIIDESVNDKVVDEESLQDQFVRLQADLQISEIGLNESG